MKKMGFVCLVSLSLGSAALAAGTAAGAGANTGAGAVKQCEKYATTCKADSSIRQMAKDAKVAAIGKCILEAAKADGASGAACVKEQSGRRSK